MEVCICRSSSSNKTRSFDYYGYQTDDALAEYACYRNSRQAEVGLKLPNSLGLYDMSGNLWEMCFDYYTEDVTKNDAY